VNTCTCGAPITPYRDRCLDCARERSNTLARRRNMAKRVPPEQLEGALALQDAQREALAQHREWQQEHYEEMQRIRPHQRRQAS
jgi:hypothetical protein